MSQPFQFDSSIGGSESLPTRLNLIRFASSRYKEIMSMKNSLIVQMGAKLAFQKLPKHMRRRAMSHNIKRLPCRLRYIYLNQMKKSGIPVINKRPSRKYRRRPQNLLSEYYRRQQNVNWLKTHIWHAKRFHIVEKWNFKLPYAPTDKSFRACYRASSNYCLLNDISYFVCIELSGNKKNIIKRIEKIICLNNGFGLNSKAFVNGKREGTISVCNFQNKSVGTLNFMWRSMEKRSTKLWLWCHAAFLNEVKRLLIKIYHFNIVKNTINERYISTKKKIKTKMKIRNDLCRFRLTGPLSNVILQSALKPVLDNNITDLQTINIMNEQIKIWESFKCLSTVSQLTPHLILGLNVEDPRFNLPKRRMKPARGPGNYEQTTLPENISYSNLWDELTVKIINKSIINNFKINEMKKNLLVPGLDLKYTTRPIPVLLIQRPGDKHYNIGFGSGWDFIIPSQYAVPFWIALIMRGCRAGSLRDLDLICFEMGRREFLCPNTKAGLIEENYISNKYIKNYFKKPPAKRINYNRLSIVSPFQWNWSILIKEWNVSNSIIRKDTFYVLQNKDLLKQFDEFFKRKRLYLPEFSENCLIPVRIVCHDKGIPHPFSIICLPHENDFKKLPVEPKCNDINKIKRRKLRNTHKELLKKLAKKRTKFRILKQNIQNNTNILNDYTNNMRKLWLPDVSTIRHSCCRQIIGFIKQGQFSFSKGTGVGIGYIAFGALNSFKDIKIRNQVLFRNTNSRQYRLGKLNVIQQT